ncbi:MAG: NAD(P)-binding domain-containing protein [Planctomycetota bacterium]
MRVVFLGYGSMAEVLAVRLAKMEGVEVVIAGRSPEKAQALAAKVGDGAKHAATMSGAVADADAVVIATTHHAVFDAVASAGGAEAFTGKVVLDINNPVPGAYDGDFSLGGYEVDGDAGASLCEAVQAALPGAHVVKAFNTCQAKVWRREPLEYDGRPLVVPVCGDDAGAKRTVSGWVEAMGGQAIDFGGAKAARRVEALAALTIQLLFGGRDPETVFQLIQPEQKPV